VYDLAQANPVGIVASLVNGSKDRDDRISALTERLDKLEETLVSIGKNLKGHEW
jgi:hypothetical protein